MEFTLHSYGMFLKILIKGEIMTSLPLGNDNDLDDTQFYNRVDEISFLSDNLELTKKGSTPTILLTGIRGVGKSALMKKLKSHVCRKLFKDGQTVLSYQLCFLMKKMCL